MGGGWGVLRSLHKEPENIKYNIIKYGEAFYDRYTTQTLAVMKIKKNLKYISNFVKL